MVTVYDMVLSGRITNENMKPGTSVSRDMFLLLCFMWLNGDQALCGVEYTFFIDIVYNTLKRLHPASQMKNHFKYPSTSSRYIEDFVSPPLDFFDAGIKFLLSPPF